MKRIPLHTQAHSLLAGLVLLMASSIAQASLRNVPAQYPAIQAAINAAVAGDTDLVASGTYSGAGNVAIDTLGKAITIKSAGGLGSCILNGAGRSPLFTVQSGETTHTVISGFTFIYGSSTTVGGAIAISNSAYSGGGGVNCQDEKAVFVNDVFVNNFVPSTDDSSDGGGALYSQQCIVYVTNCSFAGNFWEIDGNAISEARCTIYNNNSILWDSSDDEIWFWDVFANIYASYSDIDGGWPSSNVINVAPLYTDLGNGNLLLQAGSPCLQAGSHAAPNCHATDFDGLIRGNPPSMGAFDN